MRRFSLVFTALTLGAGSAGAQDIIVRDFGVSEISYANGTLPRIRRGITSRVTIIKDLIDFVPFGLVSVSGTGVTIGALSNGKRSSGTGFIAMDVTVPAGFNTGSNITLNVGLSDRFNLRVVNRGLVSSITANPLPSTIQAGTPWTATVSGTDLGGLVPYFAVGTCHTTGAPNRSPDVVTFTVTRQATCGTNSFVLNVDRSATNDPPKYVTSAGQAPALGFSYIPPPPVGVTCISNPGVGAPSIQAPAQGQAIVFASGTPSPRNITIRWDSLTLTQQAAPNNEWIVSYTPPSSFLRVLPGAKPITTTVRALSTRLAFDIPGTHTISIRAKNCGQSAPTASRTFITRY